MGWTSVRFWLWDLLWPLDKDRLSKNLIGALQIDGPGVRCQPAGKSTREFQLTPCMPVPRLAITTPGGLPMSLTAMKKCIGSLRYLVILLAVPLAASTARIYVMNAPGYR